MCERTAEEIARLGKATRQAISGQPDLVGELTAALRKVIGSEVNPYIVLGLLLECVAHTVMDKIPRARQLAVAQAAAQVLLDRLNAQTKSASS